MILRNMIRNEGQNAECFKKYLIFENMEKCRYLLY